MKEADKVIAYESQMAALSNEELQAKTPYFRELLNQGKTLDDIKYEAFAVAREAAKRCIGEFPYKVQIIGSLVLHAGDVAEMKTGEGKTLTCTMAVYLNALAGKGLHVITVNEYLSGRDAEWMGQIYRFLGLTVGVNARAKTTSEKKEAYLCDITYTTNSELGFDYLRDNMATDMEHRVLRGLNFCIVDEADSILIDESRTPLIISGGAKTSASQYTVADRFCKTLKKEKDFSVDVKDKTVHLTEEGQAKAERMFGIKNLYDPEYADLVHRIHNALKANFIMARDVDYLVDAEGEVQIIDPFTGRVLPGREWSDGLHQAVQAKENVKIKQETITMATITYQNFFRLYTKLAGMTGTAKTEEEEFLSTYNMRVVCIPTNRPIQRKDLPDEIYAHKKDKYEALVREVKALYHKGQPVLVGTIAVETSELISGMLKQEGIPHNLLNAKNHAKEAEIIALAGRPKSVTIATNMAGRGTDIKLTPESRELGGLAVLGSERHESRRIDNQLRGRSGRQGDPGFSRFYVSLEDDLMIRFGGNKLQKLFERVGDEKIESKAVTRSITQAQKRVEGYNFDMRKQLLDYDDVLRRQREIIYAERNKILESSEVHEMVHDIFENALDQTIEANLTENKKNVDATNLVKSLEMMGLQDEKAIHVSEIEGKSIQETKEYCLNKMWNGYEDEIKLVKDQFMPFEKTVVLRNIDRNWIQHIDQMDKLRGGIYLRSYAQNNPLQQYVEEGFAMFDEMNHRINREIAFFLLKVRVQENA